MQEERKWEIAKNNRKQNQQNHYQIEKSQI